MAIPEDVRVYEIVTTNLASDLNVSQIGFESVNDTHLGWKMFGGKNADGETTLFLGKDKPARVTTLSVTSDITVVSGSITIDALSLSTAQSNQVMYGNFQQATTFKWEGSKLRIGSTDIPNYLVDVESTSQDQMRLENSNNNALSPILMFEKTTESPADGDGCGLITFRGTNDDPSVPEVDYVTIEAFADDVSSNSTDGTLKIKNMTNGTQNTTLEIAGSGIIINQDPDLPSNSTTSAIQVLAHTDGTSTVFEVDENGKVDCGGSVWSWTPIRSVGAMVFNEQEGIPLHTNGIGSYDHTGGTSENLFTKTSGDNFTQEDADKGNFIIMSSGEVAEIKEFVDADNVIVSGFRWDIDISSRSFYIYNHPNFVTGGSNKTEFSSGATGKFEVKGYSFTGDYVQEVEVESGSDNVNALLINVMANGYNLNDGIHIQHETGDYQPGDLSHSLHIQIDETGATSADSTTDIQAIRLETTNSSSASKCAMCIGPGFDNALKITGATADDPDYGWTVFSTTIVDRVNSAGAGDDAFVNAAVDQALFASDNDYFLIGSDNKFEIASINLATNGSQNSILTFHYSKNGGTWPQLFPTDGTNGLTNSGNITFSAPADWSKDDEAEADGDITDAYYIKVVRTKNGVYTQPVEEFIKTFASQDTGMQVRGDGTIKLSTLADASAANESLYFSSTQNNVAWKDSGGGVNNLY